MEVDVEGVRLSILRLQAINDQEDIPSSVNKRDHRTYCIEAHGCDVMRFTKRIDELDEVELAFGVDSHKGLVRIE